MIDNINHTQEALNRLIGIYKGAPNIGKFISSFQYVNDDIETTFQKILINIDVDKATGEALDVLGQIIGIPRPQIGAFLNRVFVYNNPGAASITPTDDDGGYETGYYTNISNPDSTEFVPMGDSDYARILKAKIHLNYYGGSIDNILTAISTLCSESPRVTYNGDKPLEPVFTIYKSLTPLERIIFQGSVSQNVVSVTHRINTIFDTFIYPRTLGVWYTIAEVQTKEFAYDGQTVMGSNNEGIKFKETGTFSTGAVNDTDAGVYWSGKA